MAGRTRVSSVFESCGLARTCGGGGGTGQCPATRCLPSKGRLRVSVAAP